MHFCSQSGMLVDLGTLGGWYTFGFGINDKEQITGQVDRFGAGSSYGFLYNNGSTSDIGLLPNYESSSSFAINSSGQMTGYVTPPSGGVSHAAIFDSSGNVTDISALLPGATATVGRAINANGQVTGWFVLPNDNNSHAFLYSHGVLTDIGAPPGGSDTISRAINGSGEIVGAYVTCCAQRAFLYSGGSMIDLNSLISNDPLAAYVNLENGAGINDDGWIVASGVDSRTNQLHAYLLTPGATPSQSLLFDFYWDAILRSASRCYMECNRIACWPTV